MTGPVFYVAEIQTYAAADTAGSQAPEPWGVRTWGTRPAIARPATTFTIRTSDVGYRSAPTDAQGVVPYPPTLAANLSLDRRINLDPTASTASAAWGTLSVSNTDGAWNTIAGQQNSDGRPVTILAGTKVYDAARGIYLDPPYSALSPFFAGLSTVWSLSNASLDIPIRDVTYWLERPMQNVIYGGQGGLDGTVNLAGTPKPRTRGGTTGNPLRNVTPVQVDPVYLIYQYTDGPGTVVNVAEGGDTTTIAFQSDVADLYSGTTSPGHYRTCNALGLFQLGSPPARTITADVTGAFPVAGAQTTVMSIARYTLTEDLNVPAAGVDLAAFAAMDAAYPYAAGVFFAGGTGTDGVQALDAILAGAGFKMAFGRDGALFPLLLQDVTGQTPVATFTPDNAVSLATTALPTNVAPPPFRFRVGFNRNWTTMTLTSISPAVVDQNIINFLGNADRYAVWASTGVLASYNRPNDPNPIGGVLVAQADATAVANRLGALWGVRRTLYSVTVAVDVGLTVDVGNVVRIMWPVDNLGRGKLGIVVGEQWRAGAGTTTLMVLV